MLGFALDTNSEGPNSPGELICREAFPIQPVGFWPLEGYGFPDHEVKKAKERFQESYFKDDNGTWCKLFSSYTVSIWDNAHACE